MLLLLVSHHVTCASPAVLPLGKSFPLLHLLSYSHPTALCRSRPQALSPPGGRDLATPVLHHCLRETTQHCKIGLNPPHTYSEQETPRTSKTICAPLGHSLWDHMYSQGTKCLHRPLSTGRDAATNLSPGTSITAWAGKRKTCHRVCWSNGHTCLPIAPMLGRTLASPSLCGSFTTTVQHSFFAHCSFISLVCLIV